MSRVPPVSMNRSNIEDSRTDGDRDTGYQSNSAGKAPLVMNRFCCEAAIFFANNKIMKIQGFGDPREAPHSYELICNCIDQGHATYNKNPPL